MTKIIKHSGRWFTWCERNQCARNPFNDEGNEIMELLFGGNPMNKTKQEMLALVDVLKSIEFGCPSIDTAIDVITQHYSQHPRKRKNDDGL